MNINTTIQAGGVLDFYERSDFFRLLDADGPVSVVFYSNGKEVARAEQIGEGYAEHFDGGREFDRVVITSATAQAIAFVTRYGARVSYDKAPTGGTVLVGQQGAMTQAAANVTNASAQLLADKATRRFLMVQNNHATASVFLNLAGAAATVAAGVKLGPGGSLLLDNFVPSAAIFAIGDIASNTAVVVVEG